MLYIGKEEDHANNADDDDTNDAYKTNLTFALVVKPSTENGDDLVVEVVYAHGNVIANGKRSVNVSMNITFSLDVKDQVVATERVWRRTEDPVDTPPPTRYRYTPPGDTTIEEEPVPLAEVPQTGDNSVIWFAMITLAAAGLFIINASEKKCKA